jgi:hypothetical protein
MDLYFYVVFNRMELYAGAALTGMGYMLNKQRDILKGAVTGQVDPREKPSQKNVYASDYWNAVKQDELQRGTHLWEASQAPQQSGVVPKPAYASMFGPPIGDGRPSTQTDRYTTPNTLAQPETFTSLTGSQIPLNEFTHNNMQPFFRGNVRQNMNEYANATLLENHTGRGELLQKKQEVENFFEPTPGYTNICGMQTTSDHMLSHIEAPMARRNDFPIEQVRVGPGINQGYTSTGSGGFQQATTNDFVRASYKPVNELRPGNKPKNVLPSRPQGPQKGPEQRGMVGEFAKNRPDTWYEQSPDQWLKSRAAITGEMQRPIFDVKPTARVDSHVQYSGVASANASQPGKGAADDYGKENIIVYDNERMTTQTRTVVSNVTSVVKAVVAPFLDILRHNTKEYTLDASRTYGNMQAQIPSKPAVYDPVDGIMKTTVKETTIHDASTGHMHAQQPSKGTLMDPVDGVMKTTVKETTIHDASTGHMHAQQPSKATIYDPVNHIMRTTIKETTIHDGSIGNLTGHSEGRAENPADMKPTVRETVPVYDTTRNFAGHTYKVVMYNPDEVAKKTIRETTGCAVNELGFIGGSVSEGTGAYAVIDVQVPKTQKEMWSDHAYSGTAQSKSDFRPMSDEAARNMEVDATREVLNIAAGHTPNGAGEFTSLDPMYVDLDSKKLVSDDISARTAGNISKVYQPSARAIDKCELTQPSRDLPNALEDRLDTNILSSLKENPYNLSINPI